MPASDCRCFPQHGVVSSLMLGVLALVALFPVQALKIIEAVTADLVRALRKTGMHLP
ncbi:MAG: hypothetical protein JSU95_10685 [Betaproteobacteria bacterium]|nr:MAG: hypothetical protein JSU95_10685 [Betaproteobacteria bacterium]